MPTKEAKYRGAAGWQKRKRADAQATNAHHARNTSAGYSSASTVELCQLRLSAGGGVM